MEAVGGASAVIAVVQVGFSLARTLSAYVGEYKDARDGIVNLAGELETTIIQINELNSLIADKEASRRLTENSRKLATQCVAASERLIKKLVTLLTKAQLPDDASQIIIINPEDIEVNRLTKFYWPWIKPQVDVVKSELFVMKQNILLARSCLEAQTGGTLAIKSAGEAGIVAHAKSLQLARQVLRKARAAEQQAEEAHARLTMAPQPPDTGARISSGRVQVGAAPYTRSTDAQFGSDHAPPPADPSNVSLGGNSHSSPLEIAGDTELIAQELRNTIIQELERKQAEDARQEAQQEEDRRAAIAAYQKDMGDKFAQIQLDINKTRERLNEAFGDVIEEKLDDFLAEQRTQQMQVELGKDLSEILSKLGIGSPGRPEPTIQSVSNDAEERKAPVIRQKRFVFRNPLRSLILGDFDNHRASSTPVDMSTRERPDFVHVVMTYDPMKRRYFQQVFDKSAMQHQPCGLSCDIKAVQRAWQATPDSAKKAMKEWAKNEFRDADWCVHAVLPVEERKHRTRKFLQRAILGAPMTVEKSDVLIVFAVTQRTADSGTVISSRASDTALPDNESRQPGGLPEAEIEQIRSWLTSRGMNTAQIDELQTVMAENARLAGNHPQGPYAPPGAIPGPQYYAPEHSHPVGEPQLHNAHAHPFAPEPQFFAQPQIHMPSYYSARRHTGDVDEDLPYRHRTQNKFNDYEEHIDSSQRHRDESQRLAAVVRDEVRNAMREAIATDKVLHHWPRDDFSTSSGTVPDETWSNVGSGGGRHYDHPSRKRSPQRLGRHYDSLGYDPNHDSRRKVQPNYDHELSQQPQSQRYTREGQQSFDDYPMTGMNANPDRYLVGLDYETNSARPFVDERRRYFPGREMDSVVRPRSVHRDNQDASPVTNPRARRDSAPNDDKTDGRHVSARDKRPSQPEPHIRKRVTYEDEQHARLGRQATSSGGQRGPPQGGSNSIPQRSGKPFVEIQPFPELSRGPIILPYPYPGADKGEQTISRPLEGPSDQIADGPQYPKQYQVETILDETEFAEDAEDDMLDDAMLMNKMLVKYTGSTVSSAIVCPPTSLSSSEPHGRTSQDDPRISSDQAESPVPGVRRRQTATVEDAAEDNNDTTDVVVSLDEDKNIVQ